MSKSTEVLRICEEKGIRMIDFKMTDLNGRWRHITIPVERFDEEIFTQGIGFDGSNYGYAPVKRVIWYLYRTPKLLWWIRLQRFRH